jgi:CelD/BcsL family acetyltransferase involved in cellulose biosynthesis
MKSDFRIRLLRSVQELQAISADWHDLWERARSRSICQSPEWLLSWSEAFRPRNIVAVELRRGNRLVALAPLLMYDREGERVLAFMGGGVSDYLNMLIHPANESSAVEAIVAALELIPAWTVLDLTDLHSSSALLNLSQFRNFVTPHDTCSVLALPSTRDDLLRIFSPRQRANLRNASSRLKKAGGGEVEIATAATAAEFLDDLFRTHTSRWRENGQPGVLDGDEARNFHNLVVSRLITRRQARLYRLRLRENTLAVVEAFFDRQTALCYMQGFDPEFRYFSPGTQLMFSVMEDAVSAGINSFDFLRGTESYKHHWRAEPQPTYRIQLPRAQLLPGTTWLAA